MAECMCNEGQEIINRIQSEYDMTYDSVYNLYRSAKADYLMRKYPSDNNRPSLSSFSEDEVIENWIYDRMKDIISRVGGQNLKKYSENGMTFEYGDSGIDSSLVKKILPKAGVPK